MNQRSLFSDVNTGPEIRGMTHARDQHTAVDAAAVVARKRTELHARVLDAFEELGPMTDEMLEGLLRFRDFGPSTIRKRRSELYQQRALVSCGERKNTRGRKMVLWGLAQIRPIGE